MSDYEKQHTVTRAYLAFFERPQQGRRKPAFWVYDKTCPSQPRLQTAKGTCHHSYFYSVEQPDGSMDHSLEHQLKKEEDAAIPILKGLQDDGRDQLTEREQIALTRYVAIQAARVPQILFRARAITALFAEQLTKLDVAAELPNDHSDLVALNLDTVSFIEKHLAKRRCRLLRAHHGHLITSDVPVNIFAMVRENYAIFGGGFFLENTEIWFPTSPSVGLHYGPATVDVESLSFTELNRRMARGAERIIISSERGEDVEAWVQESAYTLKYPRIDEDVLEPLMNYLLRRRMNSGPRN